MARGPKKHLKRIAAPKSWMLSKLGGIWATRPSQGPHKLRESIPLSIILKHKLKYALNGSEVTQILKDKSENVKVDNKTRRDQAYPLGIMDVLSIEKTGETFRILYDVKGRFLLKSIKAQEASFKLCRIKRREMGPNRVPYIVTHDGRTIRYPHPDIQINDTIKLDLEENKIVDSAKFDIGNVAYITGGNNVGRVGIMTGRDKHQGGFDIINLKDTNNKTFATRLNNVFVIGQGKKPFITLPKDNGLYMTPMEKKE